MNQRRQRGENLIGIMIGMVMSLLTVAAMLMAYRAMVGVSIPATRAAVRDAQVTTALLTAQMELQQAGFGIESTEAGSNLQLSSDRRRIVWRFRETVGALDARCAGLLIRASTPVVSTDGIYYLPPVTCTSADDPALSFPASRLIASNSALFEPPAEDSGTVLGEARSYDISGAQFFLETNQDCGPFGIGGAAPNRTRVSLIDTGRTPGVGIFSHCLTNT